MIEIIVWFVFGLIGSLAIHALDEEFENLNEITIGRICFILVLSGFGPVAFMCALLIFFMLGCCLLGGWVNDTKFFERRIKLWNRK